MKKCPNCNSENIDQANACTQCGQFFESNIQNSVRQQNQYNPPQELNNSTNEHYFANNDFQQNNNYQQFNSQNQFQNNSPQNKKSKIIGLILNMLVVGLGYAYVGKWGEGIVLLVVYLIMFFLGFMLMFPWIIALAIWIYSLFKTNEMIDKYNKGLPY